MTADLDRRSFVQAGVAITAGAALATSIRPVQPPRKPQVPPLRDPSG